MLNEVMSLESFNGTTGLLYLNNGKIIKCGLFRSELRGGLMSPSLNWTESNMAALMMDRNAPSQYRNNIQ